MGRWAEVYFTSPPEKREEAVLELLHELQAQGSPQSSSSPSTRDLQSVSAQIPSSQVAGVSPPLADFPLVRAAEEGRPSDSRSWESAPAPNRKRLYAGVSLLIAVLALAYMAWRGSQVESGRSLLPLTPPAVTNQAGTPAQPSGATRTDTSDQTFPASNSPIVPSQGVTGSGNEPGSKTVPGKLAAEAPPATPSTETNPQAGARAANGSDELAIAMSYLNGTDGKARDSGEAVKWLWQAVAKHNAEATLLLSDLYLRGEGVPKNCEQARILLDAEARKGLKAAAERLRNLQDFGCQ